MGNDILVPPGAVFDRALLGTVVHIHQPKTNVIPGCPLKIVHQAPVVVAQYRYTLVNRPLQVQQIAMKEVYAVGVVYFPVQR